MFLVSDYAGSEQSKSLILSCSARTIYRKQPIENNKYTDTVLYKKSVSVSDFWI